jgi:hypothetical protein
MEWNCSASHSGHEENGFLVSERSYFILTVKGKGGCGKGQRGSVWLALRESFSKLRTNGMVESVPR